MRTAPILALALMTGCGLMLDSAPDGGAAPGRDAGGGMDGGALSDGGDPKDGGMTPDASDGSDGGRDDSGAAEDGGASDAGSACEARVCPDPQICCPGCGTETHCAAGPECPDVLCPVSCDTSEGCPDDELCQRAPGVCGGLGECAPRPTACPADCPGVCTCEGTTYCNACTAQMAGEQAEHRAPCTRPRDCGPQDAASLSGCLSVVGYAWNGASCRPINCGCVGTECEDIFPSEDACRLTFSECACGGLLGLLCEAYEYCAYPRTNTCGVGDGTGTCRLQPEGCATILAPVCGCDGATHDNACLANAAGTDIASPGPCGAPGP